MSQVSKYPISNKVAERIFNIFIGTLVNLKNNNDATDFAEDLFSPTEKIMLAKRISIAFLLLNGYQYREISKILRVSVATIANISLALQQGKGGYKKILEKIEREEGLKKFFNDTIELLLSAPAHATKGGEGWRYLRDEIKKSKINRRKAF